MISEAAFNPTPVAAVTESNDTDDKKSSNKMTWARLLKRVFDIDAERCPKCEAGKIKIIAAIEDPAVIRKILIHMGEEPNPPKLGRNRGPPRHDDCADQTQFDEFNQSGSIDYVDQQYSEF